MLHEAREKNRIDSAVANLRDDDDTTPLQPITDLEAPASPHYRAKSSISESSRKRPCSPSGDFHFDHIVPRHKRIRLRPLEDLPASLETLPREIIQQVATYLPTDRDLRDFTACSFRIAQIIVPDNSSVWKARFLARYDYPFIRCFRDFRPAYALRRCVLANFMGYGQEMSDRGLLQLQVIRDMILETYHKPCAGRPAPVMSRNLRIFASPKYSPWMVKFLSIPFVGSDLYKWGKPDLIYESIQLVLSHLLLSPKSAIAFEISMACIDFDLTKVYAFEQQFTTLYSRKLLPPSSSSSDSNHRIVDGSSGEVDRYSFSLDTNGLLHIRNFWHRYLNGLPDEGLLKDILLDDIDNSRIMDSLVAQDMIPRQWDLPLQTRVSFATKWCGHSSSLVPWPIDRKRLEEQKRSGDPREYGYPLALELTTSQDPGNGFWPSSFSSIPAFAETTVPMTCSREDSPTPGIESKSTRRSQKEDSGEMPTRSSVHRKNEYIRGLAHVINPSATGETKEPAIGTAIANTGSRQSTKTNLHPFQTFRVCGIVHPIEPDAIIMPDDLPSETSKSNRTTYSIPGWKRICMVIWKPSKRYLLSVLEHADEDFGGSFTVGLSNAIQAGSINTSNIWNAGGTSNTTLPTTNNHGENFINSSESSETFSSSSSSSMSSTNQSAPDLNQTPTSIPNPNAHTTDTSPSAIEAHLDKLLTLRLKAFIHDHPSFQFTASSTAQLEDSFSPLKYLDWDDGTIEDAYAYEGAVLPGGKIMLGRFWRCDGTLGSGPGMEIGADGEGVPFDEEDDDEGGSSSSNANADNTSLSSNGNGIDHDHENVTDAPGSSANADEQTGRRASGKRYRALDRGPFIFWS